MDDNTRLELGFVEICLKMLVDKKLILPEEASQTLLRFEQLNDLESAA